MRYLIDTDWVIHYLNDVGPVFDRLVALTPDDLGLSIVSLAELHEGLIRSRSRRTDERRVRDFVMGVTIVRDVFQGDRMARVMSLAMFEGSPVA